MRLVPLFCVMLLSSAPALASVVVTDNEQLQSVGGTEGVESTVVVAGVPSATDLSLSLNGYSSDAPGIFVLALARPDRNLCFVFWSAAGPFSAVEGLTLTFDDAGPQIGQAALQSMTYSPSNLGGYMLDGVENVSTFADLLDGDPNGQWTLGVYPLGPFGTDKITSWSLTFTDHTGSAVPEPATWLLMLVGFGLIGAAVRTGRRGASRNQVGCGSASADSPSLRSDATNRQGCWDNGPIDALHTLS